MTEFFCGTCIHVYSTEFCPKCQLKLTNFEDEMNTIHEPKPYLYHDEDLPPQLRSNTHES